MEKTRLIAFYLTQFHPTKENDTWWGKGFTEWTNVTKAKPLFEGHYQPHLPTDFGFYDLRVKETRHDQIKVAKEYGIDGFCYHYYWFSGERILNRPLDEMLGDPESNMPFCLCWANENWTRRWDAAEHEVLMGQNYAPDDDLNFIKSLIPYFSDARYIRLDGAPFLVVYCPQHLPYAKKTVSVWRKYCEEVGVGKIHICAALTHGNEDYASFGFDSGVEFPPHNLKSPSVSHSIDFYQAFKGSVMKFESVAQSFLDRTYRNQNIFKGVFPSWDNTARRHDRALIILNGTPENYEYWLKETIKKTVRDFPEQERFIFINAWNEWAEGCHLEPDRKHQRGFLEATLRAKQGRSTLTGFTHTGLPEEHTGGSRTFFRDLLEITHYHLTVGFGRLRTRARQYPQLDAILVRALKLFK